MDDTFNEADGQHADEPSGQHAGALDGTDTMAESEAPAKPDDKGPVPDAEGGVTGVDASEVQRLVAEADRRGYLRALNEMARAELDKPRLFENPSLTGMRAETRESSTPASRFLTSLPRRVWD